MKKKNSESEELNESPFNGSLETLQRIDKLIQDISFYRVNQNWEGMKENLGELLNETQGALNNSEYQKAWEMWNKIEEMPIIMDINNSILSYPAELPIKLKEFNSWLRFKIYKNKLTMAKSSGSLDKMDMMRKRYGLR